jgi:aminopeptidase N
VGFANWTELWLAEGLATYFENVGASAWRPSFNIFQDSFFRENTLPAESYDGR